VPGLFSTGTDYIRGGYTTKEIEIAYATKDRLIEDETRRRQGAFYTPDIWVQEAQKMMDEQLGDNWRQECIVWDPACGTANLTRDSFYTDLILSTCEQGDIDIIEKLGYTDGKTAFAYDFLNDGTTSPLTPGVQAIPAKVDAQLKAAAKAGKRIVFFMNPPYAAASEHGEGSKAKVADTKVSIEMKAAKTGAASQQLYAQFMFRCANLAEQYGFKQYTVATFSVPTFISSGSFQPFREWWYKRFAYKAGMLFQASHFADVSDAWGISFTIWNEGTTKDHGDLKIALKDIDCAEIANVGDKYLYNSDDREASEWVRKPLKGYKTGDAPQMSSGLAIKEGPGCRGSMITGALGYMTAVGNNAHGTSFITTSCSSTANGFSILPGESFRRSTALYAARKLVESNWVNQKDEYLRPDETLPGYSQWNDDCMIYALIHNSNNCTSMRDVKYKGKEWRIQNHFFWHTRAEAKKLYDTGKTGLILGDLDGDNHEPYLASILGSLQLSPEAKAVLAQLYRLEALAGPSRQAFAEANPDKHLLAWDSSTYQLKFLWREPAYKPEWLKLQECFKALADKLRPGVYEYGFLREPISPVPSSPKKHSTSTKLSSFLR